MLRPEDITIVSFEKVATGYKTEAVDSYLSQVAADYSAALEENESLKQKIMVLADKLEEYRKDEDSLKSAVFEAQKLGSNLVRDARTRADSIEQEANENAASIVSRATQEADQILTTARTEYEQTLREQQAAIEEEEQYYNLYRNEVSNFRKRVLQAYREHIELLHQLDEGVAWESDGAAPAEPVSQTVPEPVQPVEKPVAAVPEQDDYAYLGEDDAPAAPEAFDEADSAEENVPEDEITREIPPVPQTPAEIDFGSAADSYSSYSSDLEDATKEVPVTRSRFGALKFGENYNMREDRERGRHKK